MDSIIRRRFLEILFQVVNNDRFTQITAQETQILNCIVTLKSAVFSC